MKNDCAVIITSYNTKDITRTCLKRVRAAAKYYQQNGGGQIRIVVVDNNSLDGSPVMVRKDFPDVTLIRMNKNMGCAVGYNAGMRMVKSDFILLINSDTFIEKDTIYKAVRFIHQHSECDALTCKLLHPDGSLNSYCGRIPTPIRTIGWIFGLESIPLLRNYISRIYNYNPKMYQRNMRIGWAPTSFLFLRREVFENTGGHDETMFIYMEDVEWCISMAEHGFSLWYTPEIIATHLGGSSTVTKFVDRIRLGWQIAGVRYVQKKHYPHTAGLVSMILNFGLLIRAGYYFLTGRLKPATNYLSVIKL